MEHHTTTDTIVFRPSKKRKTYRQRGSSPTPSNPSSALDTTSDSPRGQTLDLLIAQPIVKGEGLEEAEDTGISAADILRLRKARLKQRTGGVEFRAVPSSSGLGHTEADALDLREDERADGGGKEEVEATEPGGVVRRFAKQTGMIGDVDKHMMAYIESELAKRSIHNSNPLPQQSATASRLDTNAAPSELNASTQGHLVDNKPVERQPAALGKLLEIDLGNEARDRNVARTEQARRRLNGEAVDTEDEGESGIGAGGKTKKIKLGRDGKPWRGRKRRTSGDIRRDQLVEEVLRENRLEIYEPPIPTNPNANAPSSVTGDGEGDADEQIAEAFRREFMDAISARQRKKPAATQSSRGSSGKKEEELMRGPKLGGSRSARAAMREAALKESKKRSNDQR